MGETAFLGEPVRGWGVAREAVSGQGDLGPLDPGLASIEVSIACLIGHTEPSEQFATLICVGRILEANKKR